MRLEVLDPMERILAAIGADHGQKASSKQLCQISTEVLGVSGVGVMLMSGDLPLGSLCTTDAVSAAIEDLQYTLGEGPCVDAYQHDRVVLEPDLASPEIARWPAFTPKALQAGARALFGFPMRVGAARLGAMNLYLDQPGALRADQHADALVLCDLMSKWVLDTQAGAAAGTVAESLESSADFHFVVNNAAGAVSVQLGVNITEAMVRLRAYAFSHDRLLTDVARDVMDRKLSLA